MANKLQSKSLTELRAIAQALNCTFTFGDTKEDLLQKIDQAKKDQIPKPDIVPPRPEYNAALMLRPPGKQTTIEEIQQLLAVHVERGLHLSFPDPETWHMACGKKEDSGTIRMPPRVILACADKVLKS